MQGEVVVITGAAAGIGRRFATDMRRRLPSARLVLCDLDLPGLEAAFGADPDVVLERLDVASLADWERVVPSTVARFGRIDQLHNIAGVDRVAMLVDQPATNIDLIVDVNLKGALHGMRLVAKQMVAQGSGHIVNVASLAALSPVPGSSIYTASKFGLRGASLAAAVELRPQGVHVTVICPDLVETALFDAHVDDEDPEAVALIFSGDRALDPSEVSDAIFEALAKRPLEISVPRSRGALSKLSGMFPSLLVRLYGPLKRKGLRQLEKARAGRSGV